MHRADAKAVITKRFEGEQAQRRLLVGKHRGDPRFQAICLHEPDDPLSADMLLPLD
jgi:hypothetical protein